MVKPVNLNKARKAKARTQKQQTAAENRAKFGRTKAEKLRDSLTADRARQNLENARKDD